MRVNMNKVRSCCVGIVLWMATSQAQASEMTDADSNSTLPPNLSGCMLGVGWCFSDGICQWRVSIGVRYTNGSVVYGSDSGAIGSSGEDDCIERVTAAEQMLKERYAVPYCLNYIDYIPECTGHS